MDPELSRRLDRIEHRIKVIGELASGGSALAALLLFFRWLPDSSVTPSEGARYVLGLLAFNATLFYYRWQFNREPK